MKIEIPNSLSATLKGAVTRGIKAVELDSSGHLIFTLTDNSSADLGNIPMITAQTVTYQSGASGTVPPTGEWTESIPETAQGEYLWTRTIFSYMDGSAVTEYSVSRMGLDGSGSVVTVNSKSPDSNGNVCLSAPDVGAAETVHSHEMSGVTGLSEALSGKAASNHNHEISAVSGLSEALSGKAAANHNHTPESMGAEKQRLQFSNTGVPTTAFIADETYTDFPYHAAIALTGVLATMTPEVVLSVADAMSGNFAPVAECYAGGVYIYASEVPETAMSIPTIICWKAVG